MRLNRVEKVTNKMIMPMLTSKLGYDGRSNAFTDTDVHANTASDQLDSGAIDRLLVLARIDMLS